MYIGLFLLIPFLNAVWEQCEREGRLIVLAVFILIAVVPSALNVYDLSSIETLTHPWSSKSYTNIIPAWWDIMYPVTYYYIGAYIRKDVDLKKLNSKAIAGMLIVSILCFTAYNIWRSYSVPFVWGAWADWGGFENVIDATLLFLLINSLSYEKISERTGRAIGKIASVTFPAYLVSKIADTAVYGYLKEMVPIMTRRLNYFPAAVLTVICASLLMGAAVNIIYKTLKTIIASAKKADKSTS